MTLTTITLPMSRRWHSHWRKLLFLPVAGVFMTCSSCAETPPVKPPPPPVTDTRPVGEGLKVIGFAMLGAAVVVVLGRMLK